MKGDFLTHRLIAQSYFIQSRFLINHKADTIKIVEDKNLQKKLNGSIGPNELVEVNIRDINWSNVNYDNITTDTLILDLEFPHMPFNQPNGCKAVEKAIIFIKNNQLNVLLCEMKSTLMSQMTSNSGIGSNGIYKKIKDSITRVCGLLPVFVNDECLITKLKFHVVVFFNQENITNALLNSASNQIIQGMDLYPAFAARNVTHKPVIITDYYGSLHRVNVAFIQNIPSSENMEISFSNLYNYFNW